MSGINVSRLIIGGLLAGLAANIGDFVSNAFFLADEMDMMRQRLGIDAATWESNGALVTWIVADFILGFLIVLTYAAIRPRFGPGPTTAMTAGLVLYAAITVVILGFAQMGIFTTEVVVKAGLFSLFNMMVASLVGGWAYREK